MKITRLESFSTQDVGFVRATCEDGSQGWGQFSPYNADITATVFHRQVARWAIGADALAIDELVVDHGYPRVPVLVSGTIVLVLVAISLCFGEVLIQAVHLLSNDHLSVESMKNKAGLITSGPNFGGHATEHDRDVLTETTLSGTRHRMHRPHPSIGLPQVRDSAVVEAERLRDRQFVRSGHASL